jgi:hypothetical protein
MFIYVYLQRGEHKMFQVHLKGRLTALGVTALLSAGLTLAACGGATEPAGEAPVTGEAEAAASEQETVAETEAEAEAVSEAEDTPTAEPATEVTGEATGEGLSAEPVLASCQAIDIPDNPLIAEVSDTDWTKGPADAPVTLIEYGDFQ